MIMITTFFLEFHSNNLMINAEIPTDFQKGRMHASRVVGCGPDKGHSVNELYQKHMPWVGWPEPNTKISSSIPDIPNTSIHYKQEVRMKLKPSNTPDGRGYNHTLCAGAKPGHEEEMARAGSRQKKQQVQADHCHLLTLPFSPQLMEISLIS